MFHGRPARSEEESQITRIISIGAIDWRAGYEHGLIAIQKLIDEGFSVTWDIWGEGKHRLAIDWAIRDLMLENQVKLKGPTKQNKIARLIEGSDIYFHPAILDTYDHALSYAVALNIPIVATSEDIHRDRQEVSAPLLVVPKMDWRVMADALRKLCGPSRNGSIGVNYISSSRVFLPQTSASCEGVDGPEDRSREIRVAIINYRFPSRGNPYIWDWIVSLISRGMNITSISEGVDDPDKQYEYSFLGEKNRYFNLLRKLHDNSLTPFASLMKNAPYVINALLNPTKLLRLLRTLKSENKLLTRFRKFYEYIPLVTQNYHLIHFNTPGIALRRMELAEVFGAKTLVSFRGQDIDSFPHRYKELFERANHFHFISYHLLEQARKQGFEGTNYTIIPPMIDTEFYIYDSKSSGTSINGGPRPETSVMIFTAATLTWRKGHEFALKAIALLVERGYKIQYFVAGEGDFVDAIKFTIEQLGIQDNVKLLGWLPPVEVRNWLQNADIYLLVSVEEAFNNSVLQAQACGTPVICSDTGGLPENVLDGKTGFIVKRRDAWDAAEKIERLILDPAKRNEFGIAGRERVVNNFSLEIGATKFIDLYHSLVADQ